MTQTAIEWLIDRIAEKSVMEKDRYYIPYNSGTIDITHIIEQAKEIHDKKMIEFAEYVATYPDKNVNVNGDMLHAKSKYDGAERTIDLLEIFKRDK
jgi:CRISPR/Cas system-associated protein Cas5 (RAMP superfamily)